MTERASSSASGRARRRVAEHDDAHHGRQAVLGVAREGRDPLEHGQAVAARGHGAEVAVAGAVEVDLRRHRPLARVVAHEGRRACARWPPRATRRPGRRRGRGPGWRHGVRIMARDAQPPPSAADRRPGGVARGGRRRRGRARALHARDGADAGAARAERPAAGSRRRARRPSSASPAASPGSSRSRRSSAPRPRCGRRRPRGAPRGRWRSRAGAGCARPRSRPGSRAR